MVDIARALPEPPRNPVQGPPIRRAGSVRRTSTMDMVWRDQIFDPLDLSGRARDMVTHVSGGALETVARARVDVHMSGDRTIERIDVEPARPGVQSLVGSQAGRGLRSAVEAALPEERQDGTPLHLLLDDLAGASLIAPFALSQHGSPLTVGGPLDHSGGRRQRPPLTTAICAGLRPGASSSPSEDGPGRVQSVAPVPPLLDPNDPDGWHQLPDLPLLGMRRSRRIDVWRTRDLVRVDSMFRDLVHDPDGNEVAVHEYAIDVSIDATTDTVLEVTADPRVLPFPECPAAAPNVHWLIGLPVAELRTAVLERFRGANCCTHLNDAMRALADVPRLARYIPLAQIS